MKQYKKQIVIKDVKDVGDDNDIDSLLNVPAIIEYSCDMFSNFTHMIRVPSNSAKKQNKLESNTTP